MNSSARRAIIINFVSAKMKVTATFGQYEQLHGERPFDELVSSHRRKSFTVKLQLRTQFLSGANNDHNL